MLSNTAASQVGIPALNCRKLCKVDALLAPVSEIRRRSAHVFGVLLGNSLPNRHNSIEMRKRERPQQHRVYGTENRGVGADAQSQRSRGHKGESRTLAQLPQGIPQILHKAVHACASCINLWSSSSATTLPSNRWTSRWACLAKRGSCVTMQMVAPSRWRSDNSSITASPLRESKFPVGSSASRIDGFPANARATATRCCWPPESCEG